ncbi:hypothetical protein AV530_014443 [Patagioenas fasciata monilis]|uniref:Uncharacterized protein n=1 Tax=Patagioenas fasciata monilis TaxID=372326 RepID=A0A1V4KBS5_PATFA|nr:hypothetical protein AV530_014443 [Patagioenas fasciata monilis]
MSKSHTQTTAIGSNCSEEDAQDLKGNLALVPDYLAPPNLDYAGYHKYTDEMLPSESPVLCGLHHDAEVGYLTATSDNLFKTLSEMLPMSSSVGEGSGQSAEEKVKFFICVTDLLIQYGDLEIWTEGLVLKWCGFLACSILTPFWQVPGGTSSWRP